MTLRESAEDDKVYLSARAVPGYDAAALCAKFGGGGHKGAAGTNLALPMNEALEVVTAALKNELEEV